MSKKSFSIKEEIFEKEKPELIKMILEYTATEQDHNIETKLFKELIVNYAKLSKKLKESVETITKLSVTDSLTQIFNRIKFHEELSNFIVLHKRYKTEISIVMFDIDHFKKINDIYGHDIGDKVLKELCMIVKTELRETDIFARWGGEEFMILLPSTSIINAEELAHRLNKTVEGFSFIKDKVVTCSFGVTEFLYADTIETFTKRVDDALYKAKNEGRNTVRVL